jgi:hypothetical protein
MFSPHQSTVPVFWSLGDLHPDFFLTNIMKDFQGTLRMGKGQREEN